MKKGNFGLDILNKVRLKLFKEVGNVEENQDLGIQLYPYLEKDLYLQKNLDLFTRILVIYTIRTKNLEVSKVQLTT
jgi:hypothetical protein